ncbi:MAG: hypothetical protein LBR32_05160 [Propionibacteriaceae bacterium]|nr:hypothetical protein [Propionibacteriaceae bacterium]
MTVKIAAAAGVCAGLAASFLVGGVPASADEPDATTIGAPSFPHAERATNTAIRVTWGKVAGADGYVVYKYDKKAKKFAAERVLSADRKSWVDKGEPTGKLQRYKVAAYTTVDGRRVEGQPTYQVSAMPYRRDDKVVNAGAIKAVDTEGPIGQPLMEIPSKFGITASVFGSYYVPSYVQPSAWGKAARKTVADPRVRARQLSGRDVISLLKGTNGHSWGVDAKKLGEAKVLLVAHNGNHRTVTVRIKDYAHPAFDLSQVKQGSPQWELLTGYAQLIGDIVQTCMDNQPCRAEASLDDETGDLKIEDTVEGAEPAPELVAVLEQLLDNFPYPIAVSLLGGQVEFTMWSDPDQATTPQVVYYYVGNHVGDDGAENSWLRIAPYWFASSGK